MIKQKAYAKLDLGIKIRLDKAEDGYYPVTYIDCQIDICDELTFEFQKKDIEVVCNDPQLPTDERNFVFKTAKLLKGLVGNSRLGAKISIIKNIPIRAGFGGGSSDAAATLLGLCELWDIKINHSQVKTLANVLGKDFFYSVYGGISEVVGTGKKYAITKLPFKLPEFWLTVVVPNDQKPSTAWVYEHLNLKNSISNPGKLVRLKKFIGESDKIGVLKNISNDFEQSVSLHFPVVNKMKADLTKAGAKTSIMAGAGLSVVGFFDSKKEAEVCRELLNDRYREVFVSKIIDMS